MTNHNPTLRRLLQMADGSLDPTAAQSLRTRIASDPALNRRWKRIDRRWRMLRNADRQPAPERDGVTVPTLAIAAIPRSTELRGLRHAEAIAAFVEQRASRDVERQIEAKCWSNASWLSEVVAAYFDHRTANSEIAPDLDDSKLMQRLLALNPARGEPTHERAVANLVAAEAPRIVVKNAAPASRSEIRSRSVFARYWPAFLAASILICAGSLAWLFRSTEPNLARTQEDVVPPSNSRELVTQERKLGIAKADRDDAVASIERDEPRFAPIVESDVASPESELDNQPGDKEQSAVASLDWNTIFDSFSKIPEPPPAQGDTDPTATENFPEAPQPVGIEWSETKGILATRERGDQPWQGLATDLSEDLRFEFAALPGSWALGKLDRAGKLTLSNNSQVRIWRTPVPESDLYLALSQGQVALSELPDLASLDVVAGTARWLIAINSPNTSIAVDLEGMAPRLQVDSGAALVNGTRVVKGQELVWGDSSSTKAEKTRERPRWIQTAPASIRNAQRSLNRDIQDQLSTSRDVVDELRVVSALADAERVTDRVAAARMLVTFEPQQYAMAMLESSDTKLGNEVLLWLFAQNPRLQPARPIWAAIVRRTQSPEKVRQLIHWIELAQLRSRVTSEAALTMVQWLEDDQMFFRRSGQFFLGLAFGNHVEYDPQWPTDRRAGAAQSWRDKIIEHYRTRQRRDAATQRAR